MASLVITGVSETSASWYVAGLGNYWHYGFYNSIVVSLGTTGEGSMAAPSGILQSISPPPAEPPAHNNRNYHTPTHTIGLASGTSYTLYAYAQIKDGRWFSAGSASFATPKPRPSNWGWGVTVSPGIGFNITADNFASFCNRVNEFRSYKGLGSYSFIYPSSNEKALASIFNQAVAAISVMSPSTTPIPAYTGEDISALHFTRIRDSLNSIN